jgi:hypothetical protein
MDGEDLDQAGDSKDPQHLLLRRSQQQVTPGVPSVLPHAHERGQAAGVDELQACQINDDLPLAGGDLRERSRDKRGIGYVKLAAQHDNDATVGFTGPEFQAAHWGAFLLQQQGGGPTRRLVRQLSTIRLRRMLAAVLISRRPPICGAVAVLPGGPGMP